MRVITPQKLEDLKTAVVAYAVALGDGPGRWKDEQAVAAQLTRHRLTAGALFPAYAETPTAAGV